MNGYPLCDDTFAVSGGYFAEQVAITVLAIVVLILLMIHGFIVLSKVHAKHSRRLPIMHLCLIGVALLWIVNDMFRWVIDPFTSIAQDNIGCAIIAHILDMMPTRCVKLL